MNIIYFYSSKDFSAREWGLFKTHTLLSEKPIMFNITKKFYETVSKFSHKVAFGYKADGRWHYLSYKELKEKILSFSSFIKKKGIKKGDRVAIILENTAEWPLTFFGTIFLGAIPVPIDYQSSVDELGDILNDSGSIAVFTDTKTQNEKINKLDISFLKHRMIVDSQEFRDSIAGCKPEPVDTAASQEDTASVIYTSGTTGEPKGVVLSHKNLVSNSVSLFECRLFTLNDSVLAALPLHHPYPLMATVLLPLLNGGKAYFAGNILRSDILSKTMKETNPTFFIGIPEFFNRIYKNIDDKLNGMPFIKRGVVVFMVLSSFFIKKLTGFNLPKIFFKKIHLRFGKSVRVFVTGGAKLSEDVETFLRKFGFIIIQGYGITEASPVVTLNPLSKPKIGSIGKPLKDVEVKLDIKNEYNTSEVPEGKKAGEILVKGPNVMKGYYNKPEMTRETLRGGFLRTGDIGYSDDESYLFITGREKDIIVLSSGKNIYPEEIEKIYMSAGPVREMCVFDIPSRDSADKDTILGAVIVPDHEIIKKYGEVNLRHLIKPRLDEVSKKLSSRKRISRFAVSLEELPKTRLGKLKRNDIKKKFLDKVMTEKKTEESAKKSISEKEKEYLEEDINRVIVSYIKEETSQDLIRPDDLLEELGIDSLGRIELSAGIERIFGTRLDTGIFLQSFTVKELIENIKTALPEDAKPKKKTPRRADWKKLLSEKPGLSDLKKIDLNPGLISYLAGFIFLYLARTIFKIFYSLEVRGTENIPDKGPFIIYSNHVSYFDGLLIASSLKRRPRLDLFYIGFRIFFDVFIIRRLIKIGRIIPVDFTTRLLEALKISYYVLENGKSLCIFPEGERSPDGKIHKFKKGFGILAKESNVKILPVLIEGAYEAWPRSSKFPGRHPIKVIFGEPFMAEAAIGLCKEKELKDDYEKLSEGARRILIGVRKNAK